MQPGAGDHHQRGRPRRDGDRRAHIAGGELAALSPATLDALNQVLPPFWSHANPVDVLGDATPERYRQAVEICAQDPAAFDKIERSECPQAANLLYKIIDARSQRSTTVVTNVDFDAWDEYLGDPPLAMAFLDRVVDGAIILKINGRSYRAHRAGTKKPPAPK